MFKRQDSVSISRTLCHNLQTTLLAQIEAAECRSWKQLVLQGEQTKKIIARVRLKKRKQAYTREVNVMYPKTIFSIKKKRYSSETTSFVKP